MLALAASYYGYGVSGLSAAASGAMDGSIVDAGGRAPRSQLSRVALVGQTGAAGETRLYRIVVPAGRASLNLHSYGGTGNVSLYVACDRVPTAASFDRKSVGPGNAETVVFIRPAAGTYYLLLVGETAFVNVSVQGMD